MVVSCYRSRVFSYILLICGFSLVGILIKVRYVLVEPVGPAEVTSILGFRTNSLT